MSVVILLGPPGAGKGTQAARLSSARGIAHIATGDLFRENLKHGTELGARAKAYIDAGQLVPDDLVIDMLFDRVAKPDCKAGYLLDGFPRTIAQAEALERRLGVASKPIVLSLRVPETKLIERLTERRTCKQCGHTHHLRFAPPKVEGRCDKCAGELYQRSDDSVEVVQKRLQVYKQQTQPLESFYDQRGLLRVVDGDRSESDVFRELHRAAFGVEAA